MTRLGRSAALGLGPIVLLACGSAPSAPSAARPDSGISGRVVLSPSCPVQRPGRPCERPYQATVSVLTAADHRLVASVRSARDGSFRLRLAPGRYLLRGAATGFLPRPVPTTAVVRPHRFTRVLVVYDTGIR